MYTEGRVEFYTRCQKPYFRIFHMSHVRLGKARDPRWKVLDSQQSTNHESQLHVEPLPLHCMRFIAYIKGPIVPSEAANAEHG